MATVGGGSTRRPGGESAQVAEEIACMETLCRALAHGLSIAFEPDQEGLSAADARDCVVLATQLLSSDNHEGRIASLLQDVQPPLVAVLVEIVTTDPLTLAGDPESILGLQRAALSSIAAVLNLAGTSRDIKAFLKRLARSLNLAEVLVRYAAHGKGFDDAALECLYVLAAKIEFGADIMECRDAVHVLVTCSTAATTSTVGVRMSLRTLSHCAQIRAERLANLDHLTALLRFVCVGNENEYNATSVLTIFRSVLISRPEFLFGGGGSSDTLLRQLWDHMVSLVAWRDAPPDELQACADLMTALCVAADVSMKSEKLGTVFLCAGLDVFQTMVAPDLSDGLVPRLRILENVVISLGGKPQLDTLIAFFIRSTPLLSFLIGVAMRIPPRLGRAAGDDDMCAARASLILAILLSKHPTFRAKIYSLSQAYPVWMAGLGEALSREVEAEFQVASDNHSAVSSRAFSVPLVDAADLFLNCVSYVDESAPRAWTDMTAMESVLAHLFTQQERALGKVVDPIPRLGAAAASPSPPPLSKELFLTFAVMSYAIFRCFTGTRQEAVNSSSVFVGHSVDTTEAVGRWEHSWEADISSATRRQTHKNAPVAGGADDVSISRNPFYMEARRQLRTRSVNSSTVRPRHKPWK